MPIQDSISQQALVSLIGQLISGRPSDDDPRPPGHWGPGDLQSLGADVMGTWVSGTMASTNGVWTTARTLGSGCAQPATASSENIVLRSDRARGDRARLAHSRDRRRADKPR
jgi:hypothetical protein